MILNWTQKDNKDPDKPRARSKAFQEVKTGCAKTLRTVGISSVNEWRRDIIILERPHRGYGEFKF